MTLTDEERKTKQARHDKLYAYWNNMDFDPFHKAENLIKDEIKALDPDTHAQVIHHSGVISFLRSEIADGDEYPEETNEMGRSEIAYRQNEIETLLDASPGLADVQARLKKAEQARHEYSQKRDRIQREIDQLFAELRKPVKPQSDVKTSKDSGEFSDNIKENSFEDTFAEFGGFGDGDEKDHQIQNYEMTIESLEWEKQWTQISYDRLERLALEKQTENSDEIEKLGRIARQNSEKFYPPAPYWDDHMVRDIDWVEETFVPEETYTIQINPRKDHGRRAIASRWGFDIGDVSHISFQYKRYSHLQNVYGILNGNEVLLSIGVWQNHPRLRTALRPFWEKDFWTHLETKFIKGGIDNPSHSINYLMQQHKVIMKVMDAARAEIENQEKKG